MTTHRSQSPLLRLRLTDGATAAVEFVIRLSGVPGDGQHLALACEAALARYEAEHTSPHGAPAQLELHVAAPPGAEARGWAPPIRQGLPATVLVSRAILDRRPPDDWTEIATWCRAARQQDEAITQFRDDAANCLARPRGD